MGLPVSIYSVRTVGQPQPATRAATNIRRAIPGLRTYIFFSPGKELVQISYLVRYDILLAAGVEGTTKKPFIRWEIGRVRLIVKRRFGIVWETMVAVKEMANTYSVIKATVADPIVSLRVYRH